MDKMNAYYSEVEWQSTLALTAIEDIKLLLAAESPDSVRFWSYVQTVLTSAANISKLLWPTKQSGNIGQARGEALIRAFNVDDKSPFYSRDLRNHFEHFDERLDAWEKLEIGCLVDSCVGPGPFIPLADDRGYLRAFDTTTFSVTFRSEAFNLKALEQALHDVRTKAFKLANPTLADFSHLILPQIRTRSNDIK